MHFSKEEKAMWLEDWRRGGKKPWTYAKENGLIPQTFVGWTKRKTGNKSGFVEIPAKVSSADRGQEILIEKGEVKIHIPFRSTQANCGRLLMYWQARHDNRLKQSADIYPSRIYGFTESGKRAFGYGRAANGGGAVQRECIFVLQPRAQAAESAVVGGERVLAGAETVGTRQVPLA